VKQDDDEREQARVADLLAAAGGARADEVVPRDVADRLDEALAGLVSTRTGAEGAAGYPGDSGVPTDDIASRRRRRLPAFVVAAATVSVVGLGLAEVASDVTGVGAGDTGGTESAASGADTAVEGSGGRSAASEDTADSSEELRQRAGTPQASAPPRLRRGSLAADLERAAVFSLASPVDDGDRAFRRACIQPDLGAGDAWLRVRLDGAPAVLVLRASDGRRRTADVFTCDDGDAPAASVRVQVP
jgi:hypothetical protein